MRALVVGRTGQVAQALSASARAIENIDVCLLGRPELDLALRDDLLGQIHATRPDIVINAAAYTAVDAAEENVAQAFAVNCEGAAALARATAELGLPFLHLSTDFVFSGDKSSPYSENDRPAPRNVYGQSKWAGEQGVHMANPKAVIVRLSWVYSRYGHNFAKTMLRLAKARPEIGVVADQLGRPTAAEDIAPALWRMAGTIIKQPPKHTLYHLASAGEASWAEFATEIMTAARAAGWPAAKIRPIPSSQYPALAQRPAYSVLDCARVAADFGITLPDWRQGCRRLVGALIASDKVRLRA